MKLKRIEPRKVFETVGNTTRQGLEISHVLTVSMSHISQSTAENMMLDGITNEFEVPIYTKTIPGDNGPGYGFYVYLDKNCLKHDNFTEDLAAVIELALDNGCDVLCLDSEGPEIPGLPVYEWEE